MLLQSYPNFLPCTRVVIMQACMPIPSLLSALVWLFVECSRVIGNYQCLHEKGYTKSAWNMNNYEWGGVNGPIQGQILSAWYHYVVWATENEIMLKSFTCLIQILMLLMLTFLLLPTLVKRWSITVCPWYLSLTMISSQS